MRATCKSPKRSRVNSIIFSGSWSPTYTLYKAHPCQITFNEKGKIRSSQAKMTQFLLKFSICFCEFYQFFKFCNVAYVRATLSNAYSCLLMNAFLIKCQVKYYKISFISYIHWINRINLTKLSFRARSK